MSITASVCLSLLMSGGPRMEPPSIAEQTAAREWLKSLNVLVPEEGQIDTVLKQWRIWKDTTPAAREANLALELKNISPSPESAAVVALNRRQDLKEISRANLERLKEKILTRIPVAREPDEALLNDVKSLSEDLAFHYLRPFRERSATGVNAPLASSRELGRLGLDFAPSFYSQLVGRSPSVPFTIVATKSKVGPYSLNAQVPYDALRLNDALAEEAGFVLPNFSSANALMTFFNSWEPELIEKVRRENRMSLPSQISDARSFLAYLDPMRIKEVFPDSSAYDRLSTLRERLINYVLTEPDAKELLRWAFERWLVSVAADDPSEFGRILKEFRIPTGPQAIFARRFMPALGLGDLALRVPLAVGPQSYSILEIENAVHNPFPGPGLPHRNRWDSRRLDHDLKP